MRLRVGKTCLDRISGLNDYPNLDTHHEPNPQMKMSCDTYLRGRPKGWSVCVASDEQLEMRENIIDRSLSTPAIFSQIISPLSD